MPHTDNLAKFAKTAVIGAFYFPALAATRVRDFLNAQLEAIHDGAINYALRDFRH